MKIAHVLYSLEMGGAEVLVAQLGRMQRAAGHKVVLCVYSQLGILGEALREEGFEVHLLGEAHPALTMLRYTKLFLTMRPDVVHCHNVAPTLQAAAGAWISGAGCMLATRHSLVSPPYDHAQEIKFGVFTRFLDWVAGICEITCDNLRGAPLAQPARIVRVYNGAEPLAEAEPHDRSSSRFTLLFVGRLAEIKDLPTMLRAFAIARQRIPHLRLWIVGDGMVRASLEVLAAELNLGSAITFFGQRLDTAEFFRAADTFIMSSTSEGLPMSLLQAMSIGLPAITTDVGGMREVLQLSGSGLLSPVSDAVAMAESIVRMAEDETLRRQCSERAIAAYTSHFTLQQMHEGYLQLYRTGNAL